MTTHLIIGDPHAKPGTDLRRFTWLGKFILDRRPDKVICLGDFADMPSLCSYDKGKKGFYNRSYTEDVMAAREALSLIKEPIDKYNLQQIKNKKKTYWPKMYMLGGNHDEGRINKAIDMDHVLLDGLIHINDIGYYEHGWEYIPFQEKITLDGVMYCHYFPSGVMGKAVGGEYPAVSLLRKQFQSCTAGHSHIYDTASRVRADGSIMRGLIAGCYLEHDEEYARATQHLWWSGLLLKEDVANGNYILSEYPIRKIREMYG